MFAYLQKYLQMLFYSNKKHFTGVQSMFNIANKYRPIPFWSWNDKLDPEELRRQIREMHKAGIGGFFMHARGGLQTAYLSDDWMQCVNACLDEAKKLGMDAWLYDENGWPSGFAGGLVNGLGTNFQQKYLRMQSGDSSECENEHAIAFYTADGKFISRTKPQNAPSQLICLYYDINPYYVDNLDRNVTEEFLRVTHDFYYKNIPENLLSAMKGIFTDEPQLSRNGIPWSFILEDEYRKKYGLELIEELANLFIDTPQSWETRIRFWHMIAELFSNNFMKVIHDRCDEYGWKLTGHHVLEEMLNWQMISNGAIMPQYEFYHIPGIDHLSRIEPNVINLTQVVSAAAQFGHKQILAETFALAGWNVNFHGMCWMYQQQMARGINLLCQHLEGYSLRGLRKRDYPSSNFVHQPWWKNYKLLNDYFSRTGMWLTEGTSTTDVLVLHPISNIWKHYSGNDINLPIFDQYIQHLKDLSSVLDDFQINHHYADECITEKYGAFRDGSIHIGKCSYKYVVIPATSNISAPIYNLLRQFHDAGGLILRIAGNFDNTPFTIDGKTASAEVNEWLNSLKTVENAAGIAEILRAEMPQTLQITENGKRAEGILSVYRDFTDFDGLKGRFYMLVSKHYERKCSLEVSLPVCGKYVYIIDRDSGKLSLLENVRNTSTGLIFDCVLCSADALQIFVSDDLKADCQSVRLDDFTVMPAVKKIDNLWQLKSCGDGNLLTLDHCRYRVDGGEWIYDNVSVIHHRLLKNRRDCDLEMEFAFNIRSDFKKDTPLKLICETPEIFTFALNGKEFKANAQGKLFDHAFRVIPLPDNLKCGENIISLKCRYTQSAEVYAALPKAEKFETEYNKLTFDTEIECIYLAGDFQVAHDGGIEKLDRGADRYCGKFSLGAPLIDSELDVSDLVKSGMTFFAGSAVISKQIELTADEAANIKYLRFKPIGANSYCIKINGMKVGFCYIGQFTVPVKNTLHCGTNTIEIEITISLRNLLGPHHLQEGETYSVTTLSWNKEPNAINKKNPPYNENYCFIRMGLDDISLL